MGVGSCEWYLGRNEDKAPPLHLRALLAIFSTFSHVSFPFNFRRLAFGSPGVIRIIFFMLLVRILLGFEEGRVEMVRSSPVLLGQSGVLDISSSFVLFYPF